MLIAPVLLAILLQNPSARDWIEKLGSADIAERQRASREIKALGRATIPDLEKGPPRA